MKGRIHSTVILAGDGRNARPRRNMIVRVCRSLDPRQQRACTRLGCQGSLAADDETLAGHRGNVCEMNCSCEGDHHYVMRRIDIDVPTIISDLCNRELFRS